MPSIIRHIAREDYRDKFIDGKYRGRLFYLLMFLIVVLVASCGKSSPSDKSEKPTEGKKEISAVVLLPDGGLKHDLVLFVTNIDTFKNGDEEFYKVDSLFGYRTQFPKTDSLGKQEMDSATGKPIVVTGWMKISPDSISVINFNDISEYTKKFKTDGKK